jgi:hypothetical protein
MIFLLAGATVMAKAPLDRPGQMHQDRRHFWPPILNE